MMPGSEIILSELLDAIGPVLTEYLASTDAPMPSPEALSPSALLQKFPGLAGPDRSSGQSASSSTELVVDMIRKTLQNSVPTHSRRFLDKLYSGTDAIGQVAELVTAVLNTNVHVFSVSPVFTLMELTAMRELAALLRFPSDTASGILNPGGSASNHLAMITARSTIHPRVKAIGAARFRTPLGVFTSSQSHYSIDKAAVAMGLGLQQVIKVPVDALGRMRSDALLALLRASHDTYLEQRRQRRRQRRSGDDDDSEEDDEEKRREGDGSVTGSVPFFVNLTAGTTVLSAFDPIGEIVAAVRTFESERGLRVWVHVDGSYGGPTVFSKDLRESCLRGIEDCDSVAISPHKILGLPQQCSALVVNGARWKAGRRLLWEANGLKASYLFHGGDEDPGAEDSGDNNFPSFMLDLGDATIGCGRRPDAFKLFLAWSVHGTDGFAHRVEAAVAHVRELEDLLALDSTRFRFVLDMARSLADDPSSSLSTPRLSVAFWLVPDAVTARFGSVDELLRSHPVLAMDLLDRVTRLAHAELSRRGRFMVDFMGLSHPVRLPAFFRVAISSPLVDTELLRELVGEFAGLRDRIQVEFKVNDDGVSLGVESISLSDP